MYFSLQYIEINPLLVKVVHMKCQSTCMDYTFILVEKVSKYTNIEIALFNNTPTQDLNSIEGVSNYKMDHGAAI